VRALFEHLADDPRPIARRDAAALALLFGAGVRRTELASLRREDLDTESGRILVRGKGRKERVTWLAPTALPAIRDWLKVRASRRGPLLNPVLKGGRLQERGLSAQAVYDLCLHLVRAAAILPASPMTAGGPGPGSCSRSPTSPPPRSWLATPDRTRRPGTIAGPK